MKNKGFTLAEVLITLGIIGVVAAMTLPTIITRTIEKENVTKLKKIYSTMAQAYMLAKNDHGPMNEWGLGDDRVIDGDSGESLYNQNNASIITKKIAPYLKTQKVCDKVKGCWYADKILGLNGVQTSEKFDSDGKMRTSLVLADGSLVSIVSISKDCAANRGEGFLKNTCGTFAVDTNGWKRPNQLGYDVFQFYFTKEGIVPYGTTQETEWTFPEQCNKNVNGWGCAAWVIYNENMDYMHCNGLSWNGKKKCK